ncbi:hypothetical protein BT96DRAFT_919896 [Gymnopus androsaceus JB14]|uniref:BTB domain-containing protein n=1 Tax=Gymnopus androsaceus JB14 TaxID=1447944 RepID=A0A6A4HR57_9AGAR|nr:hypothetical protein BT96DRAFT_919896 [Gymnopus androsaceus JB14]
MLPHLLPAHYGTADQINALVKAKNVNWEAMNPRFFQSPEEVLLRAENKLFRVNLALFLKLAKGFAGLMKGLVNLPCANFDQLGTEVEPIYIPVKARELEVYIDWMKLPNWDRHAFTESQLLDVFYVGSLLISQPATDWVLEELEKRQLTSARKLGIALQFGIYRWVEPAVNDLFSRPAFMYTEEEREGMGYQAVSILSIAQLRLLTERVRRSTIPPPVNLGFGAVECRYHGGEHDKSHCARVWDTLWFLEIGKKLCHPVNPMPFAEVVGFVQGLAFEGVTPQCRDMGIDNLNVAFGDIDSSVRNSVIAKMVALLPMSAYSS